MEPPPEVDWERASQMVVEMVEMAAMVHATCVESIVDDHDEAVCQCEEQRRQRQIFCSWRIVVEHPKWKAQVRAEAPG